MVDFAEARYEDYCRDFFRPRERLTPSTWCSRHLQLPPGGSDRKHGPIDWGFSPYLQEPLDAIDDPEVTDISFVGPTRSGKTFIIRMGVAWCVAGDPSPMLLVDSTESKGRGLSKKELIPLIEYNRILRERKPTGKDRHDFSTLRMLFPAAPLDIYGANSPAQVSGDTVRVVFGNEVDKWLDATDKEASILELVRHRTESYEDERRHVFSSTPTIEEGAIWQEFLSGDQRRWFVPLPCCGQHQVLEWDQVKWPSSAKQDDGNWDLDQVKADTEYRCKHCGALHSNESLKRAVKEGEWCPTAKGKPGKRSYHITGLEVPLSGSSIGALAVDFLAARSSGFFFNRQDFWNSRMGMPWRDDVSDITIKQFAPLEADYLRGTVPDGWTPDVILMGFDVQTYGLPWVVRAFQWSGESYLVDHGLAASWTDLDAIQEDYAPLAESYVIGDINFADRRSETLEQIHLREDRGWVGAEGHEFMKDRVRIEDAAVYIGGKLANDVKTRKLVISTYDFKVDLEKKIAGEVKGWHTYQLPLVATDRDAKEQVGYYEQLLDERRVPRKKKVAGKPSFEFRSRRGNNHAADCEVYVEALFWVLANKKSYLRRAPAAKRRAIKVNRG